MTEFERQVIRTRWFSIDNEGQNMASEGPLTKAWCDWALVANHQCICPETNRPYLVDPMREAFFAGAATMAQLLLAEKSLVVGVGSELEELKNLLAARAREKV